MATIENTIQMPATAPKLAVISRHALRRREREFRIDGIATSGATDSSSRTSRAPRTLGSSASAGRDRGREPEHEGGDEADEQDRVALRLGRRVGQHRRLDQSEFIRLAIDDRRFADLGVHLAIEQLLVLFARDGQVARGVGVFTLHLRRSRHIPFQAR